MTKIEGYGSYEVISETQQFSMLRVEELLSHEKFIAKVFPHPSEQEVQSLKNIVHLAQEKEWKEALEPITLLLQQDSLAIIFKNAEGGTLKQFIQQHKKFKPSEFISVATSLSNMLAAFHTSGWIIGNLRPDHIFIDPDGQQCKIADFRKASKIFKKKQVIFQILQDCTTCIISALNKLVASTR